VTKQTNPGFTFTEIGHVLRRFSKSTSVKRSDQSEINATKIV